MGLLNHTLDKLGIESMEHIVEADFRTQSRFSESHILNR